ncbi:MAG: hypothetical protein J6574_09695 [Gilliamella sp.]|nr:hypothetical protein [Gilliamella sp.]
MAAVWLFDAYFAQAVVGVVAVVLGDADGLFAADLSVDIGLVFMFSKPIKYF